MRRLIPPVLTAALLWPAAVPIAQPQEQVFDDWALRCRDSLGCFLDHRIFAEGKETNPLLQVAFRLSEVADQPVAVMRVPLGVLLPPGIDLRIDEGKLYKVAYSHCRPEGCVAVFTLTGDLRRRFERGLKAHIGFTSVDGKRVDLPLSLLGITQGLKALESAPKGSEHREDG